LTIYLGEALKKQRKAKKLTQEDLGFEAGLDRSYIGELERNLKAPSFGTIVKLAVALEMEPH
jgi:transcriptional regulator with XRE-family HTH domain